MLRPVSGASTGRGILCLALLLVAAVASTAAAARGAHAAHALGYSRASASVVQTQPPAGFCHAVGSGLYELPDPHCTPGALNPAVTPGTIATTICARGWTSRVRPAESVTNKEKLASIRAYDAPGSVSSYEYDHLVPLELGGAVNSPLNLWPEPDYPVRSGFYLNPKDRLERALNLLVCSHKMALARAQELIASEWVSAYHTYG